MKFIRNMSMVALLAALPLIAFAASKNIDVTSPVAVGNTVLKPGSYKVTWTGTGPNVKVEFKSGKKTVATANATVQDQKSGTNALELSAASGDSPKTLNAIDFGHEKLVFGNGGTATGSGQ